MGKNVKTMNKVEYFEYYKKQLINFIQTKTGARRVSLNDFDRISQEIDRVDVHIMTLKAIKELSLEEKLY